MIDTYTAICTATCHVRLFLFLLNIGKYIKFISIQRFLLFMIQTKYSNFFKRDIFTTFGNENLTDVSQKKQSNHYGNNL